jgi:hypothetical protein
MPQSLPMRSFRMLLDGYELGTWDLMGLSICQYDVNMMSIGCQYDVNMMSICVTYGVTKQMIFGVVWSIFCHQIIMSMVLLYLVINLVDLDDLKLQ